MADMRKDVRARLVAIGTKGVHIAMFLADPRDASAPDGCRGRCTAGLRSRAGAEGGSVPDAAVSRGRRRVVRRRRDVAGRGADRRGCPAGCRPARRGRPDRGARPGVRGHVAARLARGNGAPSPRPPAPDELRHRHRNRGPRLQRQHLAPRRVRDRDRLRHRARCRVLARQLPHARPVRAGRRLPPRRRAPERRRALELVPVRALRRHGILRAAGGLRSPRRERSG